MKNLEKRLKEEDEIVIYKASMEMKITAQLNDFGSGRVIAHGKGKDIIEALEALEEELAKKD